MHREGVDEGEKQTRKFEPLGATAYRMGDKPLRKSHVSGLGTDGSVVHSSLTSHCNHGWQTSDCVTHPIEGDMRINARPAPDPVTKHVAPGLGVAYPRLT